MFSTQLTGLNNLYILITFYDFWSFSNSLFYLIFLIQFQNINLLKTHKSCELNSRENFFSKEIQ